MRKLLAMLLCLALTAGTALAETAWYAPPDVPEVPKIDVPDVPDRTATPPPKIGVPEIPAVEPPDVDAILGRKAAGEDGEGAADDAVPADAPADDADGMDAPLDALGDAAYRDAWRALKAGEVLRQGSRGDAAKGVQRALIALGQDIAADGIVGPKTMAALNAVRSELGLEPSEALDAEGYAALLRRLAENAAPGGAN